MTGIHVTRREVLKATGVYGLGLAGGPCCPACIGAHLAEPVVDVGYRKGHWAVRRGENQASTIGLAVLRLDGFVSLTAGNGSVLTKPLTFTGNRLVINAQTRGATGAVAVSMVDRATGEMLPGFSETDCDAFSGDAIHHVVTWNGRSDVKELAGKPVRLRIQLRSAKLYAFQFTADEATDERS